MSSSNSGPYLSNDVLIQILQRSDPSCIFNCILVCKEWLGIITEPDFRQDYLKIWAGHPKLLVGFLTYPHHYRNLEREDWRSDLTVTLVATSKLGRTIKTELESMKKPGYTISKSSSINGFLLFGTFPDSLSAYKPFAAAAHDLPSPPANHKEAAVAIVTENSDHFKVIIVPKTGPYWVDKTRDIQTFSSSTGTWEESKVENNRAIRLEGLGLVSSKGVVYWPTTGKLQAYDTNNRSIGFVREPKHQIGYDDVHHCYGVSPQGSICCAIHAYYTIEVWVLDEMLEKQRWKPMYTVNLESVWAKHSSVLEPIFGGKPSEPFFFVSFVPGRTDCIYLELKSVLILYHADTQDLDVICPKVYDDLYDDLKTGLVYYDFRTAPHGYDHPGNKKYALSLAELGMWPVSSPSILCLR